MAENWSRHYQPKSKFVYVAISGDLTDKGLKQHLDEYQDECQGKESLLELCDVRRIQTLDGLSVSHVLEKSELTSEHNHFRGGRLAFVVQDKVQRGYARAWMSFGEQTGRKIELFDNLNDAIMFLYEGQWIKDIEETVKFVRSLNDKNEVTP